MQPARHDFPIRRGDSETLQITIKDLDVFSNEASLPSLIGANILWVVGMPAGQVTKSTAPGGGLTLDVTSNDVTWQLGPLDTTAFTQVRTPYAVKIKSAAGEVQTNPIGDIAAEG